MPHTHTVLLPQVANMGRSPKRPRALTPDQVIELRRAYEDGVSTSALATRFGVSRNTAHRIAIGEIYTDVVTPPRIPLTPVKIRERGQHSEDECRDIGRMLRHNVGQWLQVKQGRRKPEGDRYESYGMETSVIRIGHDMWGLFVRWAPAKPKVTITALAG